MKAYDSTRRHEAGCGHGCCFLEGHLGEKNKRKTRRVQKKRERAEARDKIFTSLRLVTEDTERK